MAPEGAGPVGASGSSGFFVMRSYPLGWTWNGPCFLCFRFGGNGLFRLQPDPFVNVLLHWDGLTLLDGLKGSLLPSFGDVFVRLFHVRRNGVDGGLPRFGIDFRIGQDFFKFPALDPLKRGEPLPMVRPVRTAVGPITPSPSLSGSASGLIPAYFSTAASPACCPNSVPASTARVLWKFLDQSSEGGLNHFPDGRSWFQP